MTMNWDELLLSIPAPWDHPMLTPSNPTETEVLAGIDALEKYICMNDGEAFRPDWRLIFETLYLPTDEYDPFSEFDHGELLTWNQVLERKANDYALRGETFHIESFREPTVEVNGVVRTDLSQELIYHLVRRVPFRNLTVERFNEFITGEELAPGYRYPPERCLTANSLEFDEVVLAYKQKLAETAERQIWWSFASLELGESSATRLIALFKTEYHKWFRRDNFIPDNGKTDHRLDAVLWTFLRAANNKNRLLFQPALEEFVEELRSHPEVKTAKTTNYEQFLDLDYWRLPGDLD